MSLARGPTPCLVHSLTRRDHRTGFVEGLDSFQRYQRHRVRESAERLGVSSEARLPQQENGNALYEAKFKLDNLGFVGFSKLFEHTPGDRKDVDSGSFSASSDRTVVPFRTDHKLCCNLVADMLSHWLSMPQ